MATDLTITYAYDSPPERVLEGIRTKAEAKGVDVTMTGEFAGSFVAKKLWVTLLRGTFELADGVATIRLTEVPPLMSEAQIRAKVLEKLGRMDRNEYE